MSDDSSDPDNDSLISRLRQPRIPLRVKPALPSDDDRWFPRRDKTQPVSDDEPPPDKAG